MDFEATLRRHLRASGDSQSITCWTNNEGRMMLTITNPDLTSADFVCVGEQALAWPLKPAAQRLGVEGFDSHQPMGALA